MHVRSLHSGSCSVQVCKLWFKNKQEAQLSAAKEMSSYFIHIRTWRLQREWRRVSVLRAEVPFWTGISCAWDSLCLLSLFFYTWVTIQIKTPISESQTASLKWDILMFWCLLIFCLQELNVARDIYILVRHVSAVVWNILSCCWNRSHRWAGNSQDSTVLTAPPEQPDPRC